ncbi:MAG TPA: intradiol ring-cleavage dioxygenase [Solirubrobacterales bacterium]|nr:intradiol ring-cleavage dioxygenase [Solirubrobacterales bacterium]
MSRSQNREEAQGLMRRREMMALSAGALASAALYGCGGDEDEPARSAADGARIAPDCVLTPEQEEGPFHIDLARVRRDIVEDRAGVPLALALTVVDSNTCEPIPSAAVDVWHCDALGVYSGIPSEGSEGETFLRGIQLTDRDGRAEFATVYPGQYEGRTTHIHLKVRLGGRRSAGAYSGGRVSHTGQLFTTDRDDAEVFALAPYDRNPAAIVPREADFIFREQGGSSSVLRLAPVGSSLARDGLAGSVTLGVDPGATPSPS